MITSTATHAFFPLMDRNWANIRAQVHVAADLYERHFGRRPRGMWLGECGYVPGVDELLREAAIRYFFVDTHGILFADRRPVYGVYAPLYCPSGVAAFGRDMESSEQVWSAKEGYPGDRHYRDFYRDIGFDLPLDYIGPYIHPEGHRDVHGHQVPRDHPQPAARQVGLRPGHRARQGGPARVALPRQPREAGAAPARRTWIGRRSIVSPYDAELYGHWWYEGPLFLGDLFRQLHYDQNAIETITPGDYLDRHATNQVATPCASSWGFKGYNDYWLTDRRGTAAPRPPVVVQLGVVGLMTIERPMPCLAARCCTCLTPVAAEVRRMRARLAARDVRVRTPTCWSCSSLCVDGVRT